MLETALQTRLNGMSRRPSDLIKWRPSRLCLESAMDAVLSSILILAGNSPVMWTWSPDVLHATYLIGVGEGWPMVFLWSLRWGLCLRWCLFVLHLTKLSKYLQGRPSPFRRLAQHNLPPPISAWKKSCFILLDSSDFHIIDRLSIVVHTFAMHTST